MRTRNTEQKSRLVTGILFALSLGLIGGSISAWTKSALPLQRDVARSRELFVSIIPVLKHPRCLNCHSTGDFPRQGDDARIHIQNVRRGPDGKGKFGQKCIACHQEHNVAGLNMPPGAPNWHLPPASMPMIWE